jgi:hypothetical protein
MDATNWQRPVDADGKLDLRLDDRWTVKNGPPHSGIVKSLPCGACGEIAMLTEKHGLQVTTVHELGSLESRNGIAWDVPEDKRTGRWVKTDGLLPGVKCLMPGRQISMVGDLRDGSMVWLPDAVAPEPVRMDAPTDDAIDTFLNCVRLELMHALDKFPDPAGSMAALTEEVGEVAKALLDESQDDLYSECVQTAVVALRVAIQGDPSIDPIRLAKGLEPSNLEDAP